MNTRNTAILSLLLFTLVVSAFAAGPAYEWTLGKPLLKGKLYSITVTDQYDKSVDICGNTKDIKGLAIYFGVRKPREIEGRHLSGDVLERTINMACQWALNMSPEDKLIEALAKGIASFNDFDLPKGMALNSANDFVKGEHRFFLRKDIAQKLGERISILSNRRFELGGVKAEDFTFLPKSIVYDTLSLVETKSILESGPGLCSGQTSKSVVHHRFTISADCTNAVRFDAEELTEQEMKEIHAP